MMSKQGKILVWMLLLCMLLVISLGVTKSKKDNQNSKDYGRLLIRSLHAPGEIPKGYVKVLEDKDNDRVFYINTEVRGFDRQYTKVYIESQPDACIVIEQADNYLLVAPKDLGKIYGGLSGSPVLSEDGIKIGFVSELTADKLIKVIADK